uniref:Uncharacterized protein n=1 Tax=Arundo donax TaxID=35708 RepID=A0A0A9GSA4_ARUDO
MAIHSCSPLSVVLGPKFLVHYRHSYSSFTLCSWLDNPFKCSLYLLI